MLIMEHKNHNGNDLNGFIVLSQIAFNWIMNITVGTRAGENDEHPAALIFNHGTTKVEFLFLFNGVMLELTWNQEWII